MQKKIHTYESPDITVHYDVKRCIHAAECVRSLPGVFDPQKRPWIEPGNARADEVAAAVQRCPTGALQFARKDGGPAEPVPTDTTISLIPDGPLYVMGDLEIATQDGAVIHKDTRMALCRCGASTNKPFCDGSHSQAGFQDDGLGKEQA